MVKYMCSSVNKIGELRRLDEELEYHLSEGYGSQMPRFSEFCAVLSLLPGIPIMVFGTLSCFLRNKNCLEHR